MELHTTRSRTNTLSLEQVIARLSRHEVIYGVVIVGSATSVEHDQPRDYDLVIIHSHHPEPFRHGVTYIDHTLTDLMMYTTTELEEVIALSAPVRTSSRIGELVRWLETGSIAFDRCGRVAEAQAKAQQGEWSTASDDRQIYTYWHSINFNLAHNQLLLASHGPFDHDGLDARLLFSIFEVLLGYFGMRGIPWEGDRAALRHLASADPDFLALWRRCMAECDRRRRFELYRQLAEQASAPIGGLWDTGVTAVVPSDESEWSDGTVAKALGFWNELVDG